MVRAAKFPVAKGIKFKKELTMDGGSGVCSFLCGLGLMFLRKGFNNFDGNIVLKDFKLPSDNPSGGIDFVAVTQLSNPRQVEIVTHSRENTLI